MSGSQRSTFGRIVAVVQWIVGVAAATTVVLLFTLGDRGPGGDDSQYASGPRQEATGDELGSTIFATHCAVCHGNQGQGGIGPQLDEGLLDEYPDAALQEAFVANGRGTMPPFSTRLSADQIAAVVAFTRTEFAGG